MLRRADQYVGEPRRLPLRGEEYFEYSGLSLCRLLLAGDRDLYLLLLRSSRPRLLPLPPYLEDLQPRRLLKTGHQGFWRSHA